MNVLVVMPLGEFGGGAEQMLATYLSAARDRSNVVLHFLFLRDGSLAETARNHKYAVKVIDVGRLRDTRKWLSSQVQISRLIDDWEINRVLAWMPKAGVYVTLPARKKGIPLYMWRHDIPRVLSRLDRWVIRFGRVQSVACSSVIALHALRKSVPDVRSFAIHPAASQLPASRERVTEIRRLLLGGEKGPIVGTIARLQPWKRIDLFLKAAVVLKQSLPGLRVVVVGGETHGLSAGYGDELRRMGQELLGEAVQFVGEQRQVGDWLQSMDLFVLPSQGEPFGIALVEALLAGKPAVACAGGGPEEIITDGAIGCVVSSNPTPEQMAEAMKNLLDTGVIAKAQSVNAAVAASRFSPNKMAADIDLWLQDAL
ncbi:glycosyltransferase family 4 protein [Alicyclobacillus ferrooxydans]|uniref:glycosyltransferase family 4 protein n=1 Tax=Alicyclobacillus ferrooxydans TaxID=471514 RepID=UPI0006D5960D|nr:glycosyltransferase family 4 protein [Alicyclobacillus ferrooxydans]